MDMTKTLLLATALAAISAANAQNRAPPAGAPEAAELAAFAKKTLPTLKEHKEMAAELPGTRTADSGTSTRK
jgi:hypothetical protein